MKSCISIYDGTFSEEDNDVLLATQENDGLMSKEDKKKLDNLSGGGTSGGGESGPVVIESIEASKVVQDSTHRFVSDIEKTKWNGKAENVPASEIVNGLMSKEDKVKLDSIQAGATKYTHPDTHDASIIKQDTSHRFITDEDKTKWDAKADKVTATTSASGLMSKEDKVKLDGIETGANKYTHPESHPASMITEDETHKFVTSEEKEKLATLPITKEALELGNVTNDSQVKRNEMGVANGVATLDENGLIPAAQLPGFVDDVLVFDTKDSFPETGEDGKLYLDKDSNKTYRWAGDQYVEISASLALGETASTAYAGDKGKAVTDEVNKIKDGSTVVANAIDSQTVTGFTVGTSVPADAKFTDTVYTHPESHAATMITEDESHRFVTDVEKSSWSNKADNSTVTADANGLMVKEDKIKLDSIEAEANKYTHPESHAATMITEDESHRFVTDVEKTAWNVKAENSIVSGTSNGLMSKEDKTKLDGIAEGANNYQHPANHPATIIIEDDNHKFATKVQLDKVDAIPDDAKYTDTVYTHPDNHPATMITEDESHRFVTDAEKATWNAKASTDVASSSANGLMSKEDKAKLDGLKDFLTNLEFEDLTTTAKTIVGAINELKAAIDAKQ